MNGNAHINKYIRYHLRSTATRDYARAYWRWLAQRSDILPDDAHIPQRSAKRIRDYLGAWKEPGRR